MVELYFVPQVLWRWRRTLNLLVRCTLWKPWEIIWSWRSALANRTTNCTRCWCQESTFCSEATSRASTIFWVDVIWVSWVFVKLARKVELQRRPKASQRWVCVGSFHWGFWSACGNNCFLLDPHFFPHFPTNLFCETSYSLSIKDADALLALVFVGAPNGHVFPEVNTSQSLGV